MNTVQAWRSPDEEARALRRAAAVARCRVDRVSVRMTSAGPRACGAVDCPDGWAAARMLLAAAADDARTAGARDLALELRAPCLITDGSFARSVHEFVKAHVRFVREPGEVFASPSYTLAVGAGDCDDHARLVYALLRAGGLPARLAFLFRPGASGPSHVVAQVGLGDRWQWVETTVDAEFGEHPIAAGQRLGLLRERTDITTGVRTMSESDLPALPPGFDPTPVDRDAAALEILGYLCDATRVHALDPSFRRALARFQEDAQIRVDGLIGPQSRRALASALPPTEFGLGYLADLTSPEVKLTAHLSPGFFRGVEDMARRFNAAGATVKGEQFLGVWLAESGLKNIQNLQGYPAYGLNQLFNAPEKGIPGFRNVGWSGTAEQYLALTPEQQLPYLERYYLLATGGNLAVLRDAASLYLVNFLPAYASHADEPNFVLARKHPDDDGSEAWRKAHPGNVYAANRSLDREGKGFIVVGDLKNAIAAAQRNAGPYWLEVRSRYYRETNDRGDGGGEGVVDVGKAIASVAILASSAAVAAWIVASA